MADAEERPPGKGFAVAGTTFASLGFLIAVVLLLGALFLWLVVLPGLNVD